MPQNPVQTALDALSAHVAIVDVSGRIVTVNNAWRDFSELNGGRGDYVGVSYLDVCRSAADSGVGAASRTHEGLKRILSGTADEFGLAYECGGRIFRLRASAVVSDNGRGALLSHEDITDVVRAKRTVRAARANERRLAEELGQRLTAIGLALHVLRGGAETESAIGIIELALGEARYELKRLRRPGLGPTPQRAHLDID